MGSISVKSGAPVPRSLPRCAPLSRSRFHLHHSFIFICWNYPCGAVHFGRNPRLRGPPKRNRSLPRDVLFALFLVDVAPGWLQRCSIHNSDLALFLYRRTLRPKALARRSSLASTTEGIACLHCNCIGL